MCLFRFSGLDIEGACGVQISTYAFSFLEGVSDMVPGVLVFRAKRPVGVEIFSNDIPAKLTVPRSRRSIISIQRFYFPVRYGMG